MSQIRMVYHPNPDGSRRDPGFPAADQHPNAVRYAFDHAVFGLLNVDAIGGAPTLAEVEAHLKVDAPGLAEKARRDLDAAEAEEAKIDAQIQDDLNLTNQGISDAVDAVFPAFTNPQKAFMRRLVRMAQAAGRKVLR